MPNERTKPMLYYMLESPPCRTVLAVARILELELDLKTIDLSKKEQHKPEYLQINPFGIVPTLVDVDGFTLWESRAIAAYLIQTRIKTHTTSATAAELYPADVKRRATIDKYLQYDVGTFFPAISDVVSEVFNTGKPNLDRLPRLQEVLTKLDAALSSANEHDAPSDGPMIAGGDTLTLADVSMHFSWSLLEVIPLASRGLDLATFGAIKAWNSAVNTALVPYNRDRKFTEAKQRLKAFATMMMESAKNCSGAASVN